MCNIFGTSIVFKSLNLGWHMQSMVNVLPKTLFLFVKRDVIDTASSLLQARRKFFGSHEHWVSYKPLQYEELIRLNPYQQVIGQVYYLNKSYEQQIQQIAPQNYLEMTYPELCSNPMNILEKVQQKLNGLGVSQNIIQAPLEFFKNERKINAEDYKQLTMAYDEFFGKLN
jgi:Sulfotransferase family